MNNIENFQSQFCPFGYRDIDRALEVYSEVGKTVDELVEAVNEFKDSVDCKLEQIDVVSVAYDTLYQEARSDIERFADVDICNDEPYSSVNIYGNYMCTSIDGTDEDREAIQKLIKTIKEEDRTEVINWLLNNL